MDPFYMHDKKVEQLKREIIRAEEMLDECNEAGRGVSDAQLALDDAEQALSRFLLSDPQEDPPEKL